MNIEDKPLAAPGLTSYRYKGSYGYIMIGARDLPDALSEANRSLTTSKARVDYLQIWNATLAKYINVV